VQFLLLAVVLLACAAGCGSNEGDEGSSPDQAEVAERTLPTDEYVSKADEICRDVATQVVALRDEMTGVEDREKVADLLTRQLEAVREMRERLAALGAPEGNREVAEELIADIQDAEPHLEETIQALREGDEERAQENAQRYASASMESARQVRESGLDFEVCGSGA
jgi:septation ring formation regulator EzrA